MLPYLSIYLSVMRERSSFSVGVASGSQVRDCVFDRNYRQGFSVISVINLLVERCVFSNTNGTDPQAGVDLEPDFPSHRLTNVTFRDCSYHHSTPATCIMPAILWHYIVPPLKLAQ